MKKTQLLFSKIIGYPGEETGAAPFMILLFIMVTLCVIIHMLLY